MPTDWEGRRSGSWRRFTRGLLSLILVALLAWSVAIAYRVLRIRRHGQRIQPHAMAVWSERDAEGLPQLAATRGLRVGLEQIERDLQGLDRLVRPVACSLAKQELWPLLGRYGRFVCDGLEVVLGWTAMAWWSALEVESATGLYGQMTMAPGVPILIEDDPLQQAITRLVPHRERLLALRPAALRVAELASELPGLPGRVRTITQMAPMLTDGLLLAPELLGGAQERVFLIAVQNSDELRPTGGFISSLVIVRLQGSRLISWEYMDSYDVETERFAMPPPPEPLGRYMGLGGLVFRDGNWSPDFPTSAQVLASLYQASRAEDVHGVLAIDTRFLEQVLGAIGPVPVDAYGISITAENLLATAEAYWEEPEQGTALADRALNFWGWLKHRKDFGGAFIKAGIAHLEQVSPSEWLQLGQALQEGLAGKHLQVWALQSQRAQGDLKRSGWSGAIDTGAGDYLMVVDANVGYNKVDRHIARSVHYAVSVSGDSPQAVLQVTYHNQAEVELDTCILQPQVLESYEALTQQCYWNYVRVLVPRGSVLESVQGTDMPIDVSTEGARTSIGTLLVVPPGQTHTLTLSYRLPPDVLRCDDKECEYVLTVQRQPGTAAVPLTVSHDMELSALDAPGFAVQTDGSLYTTLARDRDLLLRFPSSNGR